MSARMEHWKLGLFVLCGIALGFGALLWLGASEWRRSSIEVVTFFDESVQGLEVGSPVKFRGVPIGTVSDIGIGPDQRHVQVNTHIWTEALRHLGLQRIQDGDSEVVLDSQERPPEARVELASAGITGVKFLQVDFFDPETPAMELPFEPPENYFPSTPSRLKTIEVTLSELATELPNLVQEANRALRVASSTLDAVQTTLEPLASAEGPVFALLEESRNTARAVGEAVREARIEDTSQAMRQAAESVDALALEMGGVAEEFRDDLGAMREALEAVRALADYLERDPGALLRGRSEVSAPGRNP